MKALWSTAGREALSAFCRDDTLVALDYDGTLAAIAERPEQALMRAATRHWLAQVAARYATIVLTGRARQDARRLLGDVPHLEVIGNHGAETASAPRADSTRIGAWKAELERRLRRAPGVVIEDKGHSLTVHYRAAPDPATAEADVRRAAAQLEGVRLVGGKCVLNLVDAQAPNKGTALLAELHRRGKHQSLFVGDDLTDEDVFALATKAPLLTVRIGASAHSQAQYFLSTQGDMDELLRTLAEA